MKGTGLGKACDDGACRGLQQLWAEIPTCTPHLFHETKRRQLPATPSKPDEPAAAPYLGRGRGSGSGSGSGPEPPPPPPRKKGRLRRILEAADGPRRAPPPTEWVTPTSYEAGVALELLEGRHPLALAHFANHATRALPPNAAVAPVRFKLARRRRRPAGGGSGGSDGSSGRGKEGSSSGAEGNAQGDDDGVGGVGEIDGDEPAWLRAYVPFAPYAAEPSRAQLLEEVRAARALSPSPSPPSCLRALTADRSNCWLCPPPHVNVVLRPCLLCFARIAPAQARISTNTRTSKRCAALTAGGRRPRPRRDRALGGRRRGRLQLPAVARPRPPAVVRAARRRRGGPPLGVTMRCGGSDLTAWCKKTRAHTAQLFASRQSAAARRLTLDRAASETC